MKNPFIFFSIQCTKNRVSFSRCFGKMVFPKKSRWNMIFLELTGKMIFLFSENMILFFRRKRKDDLSQKNYLEIWCFLQMFWKDGLSNSCLITIVFVISGNMVFLFSGKFDIFSLDGKWNKMIFIKKYMEIWYFLYIYINVKNLALSFCQKKMCPRPEKMRLKVTFPASLKKIIFILKNVVFLLKYYIDRRFRKGSRSTHRRCSIRERVVPGSLF